MIPSVRCLLLDELASRGLLVGCISLPDSFMMLVGREISWTPSKLFIMYKYWLQLL
jgi:hypothetical protein